MKDWLTNNTNHLKNNDIQMPDFPACLKNFSIRLYKVRVTLLRQFASMFSSFSSFDKENTTNVANKCVFYVRLGIRVIE